VTSLPVYLDRDGVINRNCADYIRSIEEWIPLEGSLEAMAALSSAGHPLVVVTNQSAVARGYTDVAEVEAIHRELLESAGRAGAVVSGIYYCPHHPDDGCGCRKPATGLIDRARRELGLPPGGWMVGDASSDIELGRNAELRTILVLTGRGADTLARMERDGGPLPDAVCRDLSEAAVLILRGQR
jgi:D-glycero-D-manno-heptose 1,7-bisphosphate phosphatase